MRSQCHGACSTQAVVLKIESLQCGEASQVRPNSLGASISHAVVPNIESLQ